MCGLQVLWGLAFRDFIVGSKAGRVAYGMLWGFGF